MTTNSTSSSDGSEERSGPHRRRARYTGNYPRKFDQRYKELNPEKYPETVNRVRLSGKTPAGMHIPVMLREVVETLDARPGARVVDCTLGYGGHAGEILRRIQPGGCLIGLDVDPIELPHTEKRLRALGFGAESLIVRRTNFAGLRKVLDEVGWTGADGVLADLGVSSMQLDTPDRGFSMKVPGPLDMRMNPMKGAPASAWIARMSADELAELFLENADEPRAALLAGKLAGRRFDLTTDLSAAVRTILTNVGEEERNLSVRRIFQALRIAVNEEFTVLDTLLREIPNCLNSRGRAVMLTFHSGEDRRVKTAFKKALQEGRYLSVADEIVRPDAQECRANPRATAAKLRWAVQA